MDTPKGKFGRHRKIMPFEPGSADDLEALRRQSREKARGILHCMESHIGRLGAPEGVTIEEQALITEPVDQQLSMHRLEQAPLSH